MEIDCKLVVRGDGSLGLILPEENEMTPKIWRACAVGHGAVVHFEAAQIDSGGYHFTIKKKRHKEEIVPLVP